MGNSSCLSAKPNIRKQTLGFAGRVLRVSLLCNDYRRNAKST
jgi:hypothetical protein